MAREDVVVLRKNLLETSWRYRPVHLQVGQDLAPLVVCHFRHPLPCLEYGAKASRLGSWECECDGAETDLADPVGSNGERERPLMSKCCT